MSARAALVVYATCVLALDHARRYPPQGPAMSELLEYTVEDLARRNGAHLLAVQLQAEIRRRHETVQNYERLMTEQRATLDEAQRIGINVMRLARAGRKSVRVDEVTP